MRGLQAKGIALLVRRVSRIDRRIAAAACLLILCALSLATGPPDYMRGVAAAPPLVRTADHPFDPDWLVVNFMLRTKCVACHRPGTEQHDFTTYAAVMGTGPNGTLVVAPGKPELSPLMQYVKWNHRQSEDSPDPPAPLMPPEDDVEWLTAGQLKALERWIRNGAVEFRTAPEISGRPLLETDFVSARECAHCHPRQYEQWSRSMHAYAQHSPAFEAFTLTMVERTGGTIGTFCTRCHTPIGVSLGETASTRNVHRSQISMEGVTCVVCHRLQGRYYKASGRLPVVPGQELEGCLFGPFDDPVALGDISHAAAGSSAITQSAFCGACHDVTSPQGVRLEEAFSEWQNSPAAKEGITCQECHMGPIAGVPVKRKDRPYGKIASIPGVDPSLFPDRPLSDHTFAGPDYSLLPDTEFPHKLDWMYETDYRDTESLTPYQKRTLTELRIRNREQLALADAKRYELLRNAARISVSHPEAAEVGERVRIDIDVTSTTAGHNFPTGFTAERQAWVEVVVTAPSGEVIFASGNLDASGDLRDEHSAYVERGELLRDRHLLNFQSKFTALTVQGTERTVIIPVNRHLTPINVIRPPNTPAQSFGRPFIFRVSKGSLPPLQTASRSYPFRLPEMPGQYQLRVRLNYRHLPPTLFDKIGIPHLKHLLEIVVIDEYRGTVHVSR